MEEENTSIFYEKCEFLPNIRNEKSTELVSFEQKVSRLNERYIKSIQEIINWHGSPIESRIYPESFKQNRTSFKQKVKRYELDKTQTACTHTGSHILKCIFNFFLLYFVQNSK